MINVEVSMVINRPVADVYAFVANLENLPRWDTDFQEVKRLTSTPDGAGATYQCLLKFSGKNATQKVETTECVVDQKITYESEATKVAKAKVSIRFESVAEGTKITSLLQPELYSIRRDYARRGTADESIDYQTRANTDHNRADR